MAMQRDTLFKSREIWRKGGRGGGDSNNLMLMMIATMMVEVSACYDREG
jgi:hypothetical protein